MLRHGLVLLTILAACKGKKPGWTEGDRGSGSGSATKGSGDLPAPTKPTIPANGKTLDGMTLLSVGAARACAYGDGKLWCWEPGADASEVAVPAGAVVTDLGGAQCGLLESGELWCWGAKEMKVPANVQSGGQIASAGDEVCVGHRMDIKCWKVGATEPHAVWGWAGVDKLSISGQKVCSDIAGGTVECSDISQAKPSHDPVPPPDGVDVSALAIGGNLFCAMTQKNGSPTGEVACWADNAKKATKVPDVKGATAMSVSPSGQLCMILGGGVGCWKEGEAKITQIQGVSSAQAIGVGANFGCALDGGKAVCWGAASKDPNTAQAVSKK
jgi:hypothetical protein